MRNIFFMFSIIIVMSGTISACADYDNPYKYEIVSNYSELDEDMKEAAIGTYVGEAGSILILNEDGTSQYYFITDSDIHLGNWEYKSDQLAFTLNGKRIYSDIENNDTSLLLFKGDYGWATEEYKKVCKECIAYSDSEYKEIINEYYPDYASYDKTKYEDNSSSNFDWGKWWNDLGEAGDSSEETNNQETNNSSQSSSGSDIGGNSDVAMMPVFEGSSLQDVVESVSEYGLTQVSDSDFGFGTRCREMSDSAGGLMIDIIYCSSNKKLLCVEILTTNVTSTDKQKEFVRSIAPVCCPSDVKDEVIEWVYDNVGGENSIVIDNRTYSFELGPNGNIIYFAGYDEWAIWDNNNY